MYCSSSAKKVNAHRLTERLDPVSYGSPTESRFTRCVLLFVEKKAGEQSRKSQSSKHEPALIGRKHDKTNSQKFVLNTNTVFVLFAKNTDK